MPRPSLFVSVFQGTEAGRESLFGAVTCTECMCAYLRLCICRLKLHELGHLLRLSVLQDAGMLGDESFEAMVYTKDVGMLPRDGADLIQLDVEEVIGEDDRCKRGDGRRR